jgi:hypothetical protein
MKLPLNGGLGIRLAGPQPERKILMDIRIYTDEAAAPSRRYAHGGDRRSREFQVGDHYLENSKEEESRLRT